MGRIAKHVCRKYPLLRLEWQLVELPPQLSAKSVGEMRVAMRLSLAVGALMLAGKVGAYFLTGSAAILSDAAESVIHMAGVGFAAFSLWLSTKPANHRFPFGYERVIFFSAGFEGALIILAAIGIIGAAVRKWLAGLTLENLGAGTLLVLAAALVNAALGLYLTRVGRRHHSLILEANGKHVLTDSWTSLGVVGGLCLVMLTGWKPFDPLCAFAVALNILWSGGQLAWRSVSGLMDYSDPGVRSEVEKQLDRLCDPLKVRYHGVRIRDTGYRLMVHVHLLFPYDTELGEAHRLATEIEQNLRNLLGAPAEIVTHLEAVEDHEVVHPEKHFPGEP
jgi:cation diffusion facilitator family transporter